MCGLPRTLGPLVGVLLLFGAEVCAQGDQDADFLFRAPHGSAGVRLGANLPRASGGIFDFVTEQLTLEKGDFRAASIGGEAAFRIIPRLDAVVGVDYLSRTSPSEVRAFSDENDNPITQETRLMQLPITASLRFYLTPKGESVGQYAWVPARFAPYLGAGGGATWYRFSQTGEFVDEQTLVIFEDDFRSAGWGSVFLAYGGVEFNISRRMFADFQIRYSWADAKLGRDFRGFDPIDLAGLRAIGGFHVRY